jgi:hypothetical protein
MFNAEFPKRRPVEARILPLVEALNETKILKTFSSCQGHYKGIEQRLQDRNFADVRFFALPTAAEGDVETLLRYINGAFFDLETQMHVQTYKNYIGFKEMGIYRDSYAIIIKPTDRFEHPARKRACTDEAIQILTVLVKDWKKRRDNNECPTPGIVIPKSLLHYLPDKKIKKLCECSSCMQKRIHEKL